MRKILLWILSALLLISVSLNIFLLINPSWDSDCFDVQFKSGEYFNKMWRKNEEVGVIKTDCAPDMQSAVRIANIAFVNCQQQGRFKNYELQSVFYDESDCVWVVSYWEPIKNAFGSSVSIAVSQKNGEILKIWAVK